MTKNNPIQGDEFIAGRDFLLPEGYSPETLHRVQRLLVEAGAEVSRILTKHGIDHFLGFGTLLGQVRHGGFIPWDDDFDFCLFDSDYPKAIDVLRQELSAEYIIHDRESDPNYFHAWARVRLLQTRVQSSDKYDPDNQKLRYQCLGIDLYPLTVLRSSQMEQYRRTEKLLWWNRKKANGWIPDGAKPVDISHLPEKNVTAFGDQMSGAWFFHLLDSLVPVEDIQPIGLGVFEDRQFPIPRRPESFLLSAYGPFEDLPPLSSRRPSHMSVSFTSENAESWR